MRSFLHALLFFRGGFCFEGTGTPQPQAAPPKGTDKPLGPAKRRVNHCDVADSWPSAEAAGVRPRSAVSKAILDAAKSGQLAEARD